MADLAKLEMHIRVDVPKVRIETRRAMGALREASRAVGHTIDAFDRLGEVLRRMQNLSWDDYTDFPNQNLDGATCVEDWDEDFDPRSILIKDI